MGTQKNPLNETVLLSTQIYVNSDGLENIYHFKLKHFVYLNLWTIKIRARSSKHIMLQCFTIHPLIHEKVFEIIKNNFKYSSRKHYVHEKFLKESRTNLKTVQEHIMIKKSL